MMCNRSTTEVDYQISTFRDYTVFEIRGVVDAYNCNNLRLILQKSVEQKEVKLVIDFKNLEFLDSSAISILVVTYRKVTGNGGSFTLINADDNILDILSLATLDTFFSVLPNRAALP